LLLVFLITCEKIGDSTIFFSQASLQHKKRALDEPALTFIPRIKQTYTYFLAYIYIVTLDNCFIWNKR